MPYTRSRGGLPRQCMRSPPIFLILSDDMGYSDVGCYGGEIETPTLDRLAHNGIRFTRFYNQVVAAQLEQACCLVFILTKPVSVT